jgi:hypothetical protein
MYKVFIFLSVFMKIYSTLNLSISNTLVYLINRLRVLTRNPINIILIFSHSRTINNVKITFFTTFFKNFLIWNYLMGSLDGKNRTFFPKNSTLTKKKIINTVKYNSSNKLVSSTVYKTFCKFYINNFLLKLSIIINKSFSFSWYYINGFFFVLFIDACLTDDEPLWEPIEWSLVQTWILFIFSFAWIAENLIVSRYGSYAGRDKRVWMAWYKTFWLIEGYYVFNYGVAVILVMVPFYFELNYNLAFIYSWWNWFSKVFFYKFTLLYSIILLIALWLQINVRWVSFKKALLLISFINIILAYLIYTQFIIIFFGYFTDPLWYQKTRYVDYVQLSHEPSKWGWGSSKKDHFTYHGVRTVLWFKNDGPFATSFLFCQIFFFVCLFCLFIYWIVLFRRVHSLSEVPLTYTTYCVSSLKQFFFFFLYFYIFILLSFLSHYWRFPMEYFFTCEYKSWYFNFYTIIYGYPKFLYSIIFS